MDAMKNTFPELPKGYRWVRRGEWVSADDSQAVFGGPIGDTIVWRKVTACFPFDRHNWKPHKCATSRAYIRNVKSGT